MVAQSIEVIILAAGKGSRMHSDLPKTLHSVAGKPMLGHVIDSAKTLSPKAIHIVVGHKKDQVKSAFSQESINWVEQKEQLGTGHAVAQVTPFIGDNSTVIILAGDVPLIQPNTLNQLANLNQTNDLTLLTAAFENPFGLGRIIRNGQNDICGIVEEKDATTAQKTIKEINSGILAVKAKQLKAWLARLDNNNAQKEYYLTDIVKFADADSVGINNAFPSSDNEIQGVNSRTQLAIVERAYQRLQVQQLMDEGTTVLDPNRCDIRGSLSTGKDCVIDVNTVFVGDCVLGDNVYIAPNSIIIDSQIGSNTQILANTIIEQSSVGKNANIGPFARLRPKTQLADKTKIGNFVETKNAQLDEGTKVNHLSYVGDAVVGKNTNIGAGVITCNYDGANKHLTKIGDNVFVGSDCQLVAPVSIADDATIGAGSTITKNVDASDLALSRNKQQHIKGWKRPVKKT